MQEGGNFSGSGFGRRRCAATSDRVMRHLLCDITAPFKINSHTNFVQASVIILTFQCTGGKKLPAVSTSAPENVESSTHTAAASGEVDNRPRREDEMDFVTPPPSYSTLSKRVKETRESSRSVKQFLASLLVLIWGTVGLTYLLIITVVIPGVMVVIGALYIHDCPLQRYIPIYLVVGGTVGIVKLLMDIYRRCQEHKRPEYVAKGERRREALFCDMVLNCFLFGWFIAGCVWIYGSYLPDFEDLGSGMYCHRTVYYFAFGVVTSALVFLGVMATCACCATIYTVLKAPGDS